MDIDDLIRYENENTSLDFKAEQYVKKQYHSLIKDVMSMANSNIDCDKHIIIGVKDKSGGEREFWGIQKSEFVDSATYQQIILENIEPNISLDYIPYEFEGITLGILKIYNCLDRPYMMRKDYGNLKKGDCFIRKGSQQSKMERRDFDNIVKHIIESMNVEISLEEVTNLYFSGFSELEEIELSPPLDIELPSKEAEDKIIKIINKKIEEKNKEDSLSILTSMRSMAYSFDESYENMSIEDLQESLKNVRKTYQAHDNYKTFELNAEKLNIEICNKGDRYLEDCTIEIVIKKIPSILVATKIHLEPRDAIETIISRFPNKDESEAYPDIQSTKNTWIIKQHIGNIKHQIPTKAFYKDLRITLSPKAAGKTINLECTLFAKNLTSPLQQTLKIKIVDRKKS